MSGRARHQLLRVLSNACHHRRASKHVNSRPPFKRRPSWQPFATADRVCTHALIKFGQAVVRWCYEEGCGGVAQNDAEAVRLYRLSAAQGNAGAQNNLGYMFEKGTGVGHPFVPPRRRAGASKRHRSIEAIGRVMRARRSAQLASRASQSR